MEAIIIGLLTEVCEDFFFYVLSECESNGVVANANTEANYNTYISGSFTYNWWQDASTSETRTMPFTLSSGMDDIAFIGDVSSIQWRAGLYDSDTPTITVSENNGDINISTSAQMYLYIDGHPISQQYITDACKISTNYTANYGYADNSGNPIFWPSTPQFGRTVIGKLDGVRATSDPVLSELHPDAVYVPAPTTGTISYNDYILQVINWTTINYPDLNITINDLPTWQELASETESESESEFESESESDCCNCNCNTTIYVNADGSLTIQNDISGDFDLSINNDADLSLNVNAAAGAFGAGAIVIDPDAEINVTAGAGAFGAGAFGAGAIVSPDVNISGDLSVGDISGEVNLQVSEVNVDISGGDVNIDQSGSSITNNYNTTNNYYGTTEPIEPEEPFTIDYNEILSEGELESILNQETYELAELPTEQFESYMIESVPEMQYLPGEVVATSATVVNYASELVENCGLLPVYSPLAIFATFVYILRGCK